MPDHARKSLRDAIAGSALPLGAVAAQAHAASSASFSIPNGTVDAAGGRATSTNHVVTACVGSEVAGSSSSANHRIDSGCGPTTLALAIDFRPEAARAAQPVPGLDALPLALLAAGIALAAARRLRGTPR